MPTRLTANRSVYSQNVYIGADVDAVIGALASPDPGDDVPALLTAIQTFQATDHAARLDAVGAVAPGVDLKRGWVWADATVDGGPFFFASTHLEGSAVGHPEAGLLGSVALFGAVPADRTATGGRRIWPSDHAGVVATVFGPPRPRGGPARAGHNR